jgi:diguanylate cyclase (GGDEF)-like protein/PAS domain S-box-containing protein
MEPHDTPRPAHRGSHAHSDVERRFRTLVESIPGIAAYMDIVRLNDPGHSQPVYISPQIEDMLGYPLDAWLDEGELWLHILHPDDAERMTRADSAARAELSSLFAEYRMIARDGRVVWVSEKASVVEDPVTGTVYWLGVMVDITDRKRTEDALAASERQFRSVFDAAAIGLMTVGIDGRIMEANATLERICEYPAGALGGQHLARCIDQADAATLELFAELAAGARDRCDTEHRFWRSDGSLMWCRTVMALVRDGSGRPVHVTAMLEDISDRKQEEAVLVHRTLHDALTDLPNRHQFVDRLQQALADPASSGKGIAVLFIDMDGFKEVNDTLGHRAGDQLLVALAARLREAVRPWDVVARFAGDEFLVLGRELASPGDATRLARRLMSSLRHPYALSGRRITLTASLGVAYTSGERVSPDELVHRADTAMYAAKQRGRNRFELYGELRQGRAA